MEKLPINIKLDDSFFLEEEKCGYKVTAESKKLWAVILDLMVTFDSVCKQYNIKYSLDSGTLLGAVRHGGFIPWDNDADVIMFRSEYERLCEIAPKAFKPPYFWQTNDTDPGSMHRHGQLRNSATTCFLTDETKEGKPLYRFNQGAFLDVFILDKVPDDANELIDFRKEMQQWIALLWDFKEYYFASGESPWMGTAQQQAYHQYEAVVSRYNGTDNTRYANISLKPHRQERQFFPRSVYEDLTDYSFEGFTFPAPRDYERVLHAHYEDWHQYVIGDDDHGDMITDMMVPYTKFFGNQPQSVQYESSEHPILGLYKHRDMLLSQRDRAWEDISKSEARINSLLQEEEQLKVHFDRVNAENECRVNSLLQERNQMKVNLDRLNVENDYLSRKVRKKRRTVKLLWCLSILLLIVLLIQLLIR